MGFGQALDEAGAIITLIGLLPAAVILFVMTRNIDNPEFNMMAAYTAGMKLIAQSLVPVLGLTIILAVVIFLIRAGNGGR